MSRFSSRGTSKRKGGEFIEPKSTVLIVCEGYTEQKYFQDMCRDFRIPSNVLVEKGSGSDPVSTVKEAARKAAGYKQSYCIFDEDDRKIAFKEALDIANRNKNITAIPSVVCFEIWVLLHFEESAKPYRKYDNLKPQLKKHLSNYEKGTRYSLFEEIKHDLENAITRAKKLDKENSASCSDNPSTKVYILVQDLQKIRDDFESSLS